MPDSSLIEINDIVNSKRLFSSLDKFGTKIVKLRPLENELYEEIKKSRSSAVLIVGHLASELSIKPDIAIVTRAGLGLLIKRLNAREYQKEKLWDDVVSEALDYSGSRMAEKCKECYEIEKKADSDKMVRYLVARSSGKKVKKPVFKRIEKLKELEALIRSGKFNPS